MVQTSCPQWLKSGTKLAILCGLQERSDLNGCKVRIVGRDENSDRWNVSLVLTGEDVKVGHENLERVTNRSRGKIPQAAAPPAAPKSPVVVGKQAVVEEDFDEKKTDEPEAAKKADEPEVANEETIGDLMNVGDEDKDVFSELFGADFWGDDAEDGDPTKKEKKKKKRKKEEASSEDDLMDGEGEPGALVVELTRIVVQQLLVDDRRWTKYFEGLIMKFFGIVLEIEISDARATEDPSPAKEADEDDEYFHKHVFWRAGSHISVTALRNRSVHPLRRLNGKFGRLVRRDSSDNDTWHVRLADGSDTSLAQKYLLPRKVDDGEAWLRIPNDTDKVEVIKQLFQIFAASIGGETLRSAANDCKGVESILVDIPSNALGRIRGFGGTTIMSEFGVICAVSMKVPTDAIVPVSSDVVIPELVVPGEDGIEGILHPGQVVEGLYGRTVWRDAEVVEDRGLLVKIRWGVSGIIETLARVHLRHIDSNEECFLILGQGRACKAAYLRAMAFMEDCAPGFHSNVRLPRTTDELCHLPAVIDLTPRRSACIASITGAIVERVGKLVFVAGAKEECVRAQAVVKLLNSAAECDMEVEDVPKEFVVPFTKVRIPIAAAEGVWNILESTMIETSTICIWVKPKKSSKLSPKEELLKPGVSVSAEYEGEWHEASIVKVDLFKGTVTVQWTWDESTSTVPIKKAKPKLKLAQKMEYQQKVWFQSPWELAIFGARRQRTIAALQIMACTEGICSGLWSSEILACMDELRSKAGEDDGADAGGFEAFALTGDAGYPIFSMLLQKHGQTCIRRASRAAKCFIQLIGSTGIFFVGSTEQRACGFNYLRWILQDKAAELQRYGCDDSAEYAKADDRSEFKDVLIVDATCKQCAWMDPGPLRRVERATSTVVILDHGPTVADCSWNGDAPAAVHICGLDEEKRKIAASKVRELIASVRIPSELDLQKMRDPAKASQQTVASDESPSKKAKLDSNSSNAEAQALAGAVANEVAEPTDGVSNPVHQTAECEPQPLQPSDPRQEIRKLEKFPIQVQDWRDVQDIVWRGHSPLSKGWIRLWSRSKDCVYYYKLQDGTTSYSISDALVTVLFPH